MNDALNIQINMVDAAARAVERLLVNPDSEPHLRFGDMVEVAFPDLNAMDFRLLWRGRMRVIRIRERGLVTVTDENNELYYDVDISRVRKVEK